MLSYAADDFIVHSGNGEKLEHATVTPDAELTLPRGTVLATDGDGTYSVITSDNVDNAEVILAEDVEAGSADVTAPVYVSGEFIEQGLTVGTSAAAVSLTDAARLNLKRAGIYLTNGISA